MQGGVEGFLHQKTSRMEGWGKPFGKLGEEPSRQQEQQIQKACGATVCDVLKE